MRAVHGRRLRTVSPFAFLGAVLLLAALGAILLALPPEGRAHADHPFADAPVTSTSRFGGLELARVGGVFDFPVHLASPRGDAARRFVVEQDGQVRLIKNGRTLARPFLDISRLVEFNGERGLFSIAFAPDYAQSGRLYVFYTRHGGNLRVDEFRRAANPDVASLGTRRRVIEIPHGQFSNHNGGQLQFAPQGGSLYIATGDGGGGGDPLGSGQNPNTLLGKILRIDPRRPSTRGGYSIPSGNPYVGRAGRDEIWHLGLRNPWRFSFDRANGNMAIGDVGQGSWEEIDFVAGSRRGLNFGWSCFEGNHRFASCDPPRYVPPVLEYSSAVGGSCAVTGGYVVRDRGLPRLAGRYVYGDYCTGALHAAILREGQPTPESRNMVMGLVVPRLSSFGEDSHGRLYMTSRSGGGRPGAVYRLRAPR